MKTTERELRFYYYRYYFFYTTSRVDNCRQCNENIRTKVKLRKWRFFSSKSQRV